MAPEGHVEGIIVCEDCGGELEPTGVSGEPPVQSVDQACESCSYRTTIALCWYTSSRYVAIGELGTTEYSCDRCEKRATVGAIDAEVGGVEVYCERHTPSHYQSSLELV